MIFDRPRNEAREVYNILWKYGRAKSFFPLQINKRKWIKKFMCICPKVY